jgi:hypothetical protein
VLHRGREFVGGEQESTVPDDRDDRSIGCATFAPSEAGNPKPKVPMYEVLRYVRGR